jgi:hypothetical protein
MNQKPFYVYVYRDPRRGKRREPIWVGKGKNGRAFYHLSHTDGNTLFQCKLAKIRSAKLKPLIKIVRRFNTAKQALTYETQLIKKYGRINLGTGSLCNFSDGGEGALNISSRTRTIKSKLAHQQWADPIFAKKQRQNLKLMHTNAKLRARRVAALRQSMINPKVVANRKALWADSKFRARHRAALKRAFANLKWQAQNHAHMTKLHADPKWQRRNRIHLKRLWANPKFLARRRAYLKRLNADQKVRARRIAGIRRRNRIKLQQQTRKAA